MNAERRLDVAAVVAFATTTACAALAVWSARYVATNDGPHHLLVAHARAHLADPAADYGRFVVPNTPVTAHGFYETYALFDRFLPWEDAYRATLSVLVVAWSLGFLALVAAVSPRRLILAVVGPATALGFPFYLGLFPFCFGTAVAFAAIAHAIAVHRPTWLHRVLLTTLLLLTAEAHSFAAMIAGVVIVAARCSVVARKDVLRELALLFAVGLPAMIVVAASEGAASSHDGTWNWTPFVDRLAGIGGSSIGGPWWRCAGLLVVAAVGGVAATRRGATTRDRALAVTAVALVGVALFGPYSAGGWVLGSVRTLPVALGVLVALTPLERAPITARTIAAVVLVAWAGAAVAWSASLHRRTQERMSDLFAALDVSIERPGFRWPIVIDQLDGSDDEGIPYWFPIRSIGSVFAVAQGGWIAYTHDTCPELQAVQRRDDRAFPQVLNQEMHIDALSVYDDDSRARALRDLTDAARRFDGVIVHAGAADQRAFLDAGWRADHQQGRVLLARFVGCEVDVTVDGGAAASFESGFLPNTPVSAVRVHRPGRLHGVPCGSSYVRPLDALGAPLPCEGADEAGRLAVQTRADAPAAVTCRAPAGAP